MSLVASVAVLGAPDHLIAEFNYAVPEEWNALLDGGDSQVSAESGETTVQVGSFVQVSFGRRKTDGIVTEISEDTDYLGVLKPLEKVYSNIPLTNAGMIEYYREVAKYYGSSLASVLSLAVPPRHIAVEKGFLKGTPATQSNEQGALNNAGKTSGNERLSISDTDVARIALTPLPGVHNGVPEWCTEVSAHIGQTVRDTKSDIGTLTILPDEKSVLQFMKAVHNAEDQTISENVIVLSASLGKSDRYDAYLKILFGHRQHIVGTRSAIFAPVQNLGLITVWDDIDSSHKESRAPYFHTREAALIRSKLQNCSLTFASYTKSAHVQRLIEMDYLQDIRPERETLRSIAPLVTKLTDTEIESYGDVPSSRLPHIVHKSISDSLKDGPVLIQMPRKGYLPLISCNNCREIATCTECEGYLTIHSTIAYPVCSKCNKTYPAWRCRQCNSDKIRNIRIGADRQAYEIGAAFPGTKIVTSSSTSEKGIISTIDDKPQIVISTPGAEPIPENGYNCIVIMDAYLAAAFNSLDGSQNAIFSWMKAASLGKSIKDGGKVYIVGNAPQTSLDALVRFDSTLMVSRELKERRELEMPPYVRFAVIMGTADVTSEAAKCLETVNTTTLGPFALEDTSYINTYPKNLQLDFENQPLTCIIVRVGIKDGAELAQNVAAAKAKVATTIKTHARSLKIIMDPKEFL